MSDITPDESVEEELFEPDNEPGAGAGRPKWVRLAIFAGAGVALLAGVGAGAYFGGLFDMIGGGGETGRQREMPTEVVFYDLPEMVVNLGAGSKKRTYLKIQISLELDKGENLEALERVLPRVVDHFQVYLRELRVDDLHGSAGIYRLKEELLRRVSIAAYPVLIRDVLFKEMLVQ